MANGNEENQLSVLILKIFCSGKLSQSTTTISPLKRSPVSSQVSFYRCILQNHKLSYTRNACSCEDFKTPLVGFVFFILLYPTSSLIQDHLFVDRLTFFWRKSLHVRKHTVFSSGRTLYDLS